MADNQAFRSPAPTAAAAAPLVITPPIPDNQPLSEAEYATLNMTATDGRDAVFQSGRYLRDHPDRVNWDGYQVIEGVPAPEFGLSPDDGRYKRSVAYAEGLKALYPLNTGMTPTQRTEREKTIATLVVTKIHDEYGDYNKGVADALDNGGDAYNNQGFNDDAHRATWYAMGNPGEPDMFEIAKGKPVCRHYAPLTAVCMDAAGVEAITATGSILTFTSDGQGNLSYQKPKEHSGHVFVVTASGNIIEPSLLSIRPPGKYDEELKPSQDSQMFYMPKNKVSIRQFMAGKSVILDAGQYQDGPYAGREDLKMYGTNPGSSVDGFDENGGEYLGRASRALTKNISQNEVQEFAAQKLVDNASAVKLVDATRRDLFGPEGYGFDAKQIDEMWNRDRARYLYRSPEQLNDIVDYLKQSKEKVADYKHTLADYATQMHMTPDQQQAFVSGTLAQLYSAGTTNKYIDAQNAAFKQTIQELKEHPELTQAFTEFRDIVRTKGERDQQAMVDDPTKTVIKPVMDEAEIRARWEEAKRLDGVLSDKDRATINGKPSTLAERLIDRMKGDNAQVTALKQAEATFKQEYMKSEATPAAGQEDWRHAAEQLGSFIYRMEHNAVDLNEVNDEIHMQRQVIRGLPSPDTSPIQPEKFPVTDPGKIGMPLPAVNTATTKPAPDVKAR